MTEYILHHDRMIVAGKPLQDILQGTSGNRAQALVFLPTTITSVIVSFRKDETNKDGYYCWHEDKELEVDDFHLTYQADYERGLVQELQKLEDADGADAPGNAAR